MKDIRAIALYLPQFHRLPENDQWWGDGFTDWTTAKAAKPLFDGHQQPKEPLGDNYYNLLDKRIMQWQADLAKKYKIDGFCFYHYWFKDGRRVLEKPAENLLDWTDLDMPFCFCWANETWARSWGAVSNANPWADKFEPKKTGAGKAILLEQQYGGEHAWEEHFQYLLPFFRDKRYIRIDGKPVFVIYRPELIPCLDRMVSYWRKLAAAAGERSLYVIGMNVPRSSVAFDATISIMPKTSPFYAREIDGSQVHGMDYQTCWEDYLSATPDLSIKTLWCGIVDYDDTPRHGNKGWVYMGANPERFGRYYAQLVQKSIQMGNPLVFLNAWNEWGEGMYLEPDKTHGYAYLQAVKDAMEGKMETESVIDYDAIIRRRDVRFTQLEARLDKFRQYYDLMHQWMLLKEQGKSLSSFFLAHNYRRIGIYGYGNNGKHLVAELKDSPICITYAIDQRKSIVTTDFPVYTLTDMLPVCDVIIVTIIHEYGTIFLDLNTKVSCPILSLYEVVSAIN